MARIARRYMDGGALARSPWGLVACDERAFREGMPRTDGEQADACAGGGAVRP